jgi:hypothetical protein
MSKPEKTKTLQQIADVEQKLVQLRKQQEEAEATLRSLRESLSQGEEDTAVITDHLEKVPTSIGKELSRSEKVSLFLRLFRGREDVYPRRWQNQRTGKEGYAPACGNEWLKGVCEKPRVRCGECPNQAFQAVTVEAILDHLQGRQVMGVYPMLNDETCWFLAIDFDKEAWQEDVNSLAETSRRMQAHEVSHW